MFHFEKFVLTFGSYLVYWCIKEKKTVFLRFQFKGQRAALSVCCKIVFCRYVSMYIKENIYQSYILIFILNGKKTLFT